MSWPSYIARFDLSTGFWIGKNSANSCKVIISNSNKRPMYCAGPPSNISLKEVHFRYQQAEINPLS
jgi:hypothetical protein